MNIKVLIDNELTDDAATLLLVARQIAINLEGMIAIRVISLNLVTAIIKVNGNDANILLIILSGVGCYPKVSNELRTTVISSKSPYGSEYTDQYLMLPDSVYDKNYLKTINSGVISSSEYTSIISQHGEAQHSEVAFGNFLIGGSEDLVYTFKGPYFKHLTEEHIKIDFWTSIYFNNYHTAFLNKLYLNLEEIDVFVDEDTRKFYVLGGVWFGDPLVLYVVANAIGDDLPTEIILLSYKDTKFQIESSKSASKINEVFVYNNGILYNSEYSVSIVDKTIEYTPIANSRMTVIGEYSEDSFISSALLLEEINKYSDDITENLSYSATSEHIKQGDITISKYPIYSIQEEGCIPYISLTYSSGYYSVELPTCVNCESPTIELEVSCGSIDDSGKWSNAVDENGCSCSGTITATATVGTLTDTNTDLYITPPEAPYYTFLNGYDPGNDMTETTPYTVVSFSNTHHTSYTDAGCMRMYTGVGCGGTISVSVRLAGHWVLFSESVATTDGVVSNTSDCDGSSWFSFIGQPLRAEQSDCNAIVNGMSTPSSITTTTSNEFRTYSYCAEFTLVVNTGCGYSPSCGGLTITKAPATGCTSSCSTGHCSTVQIYKWVCNS